MDLNLPKFRAKRLDNGEYIIGNYADGYIFPKNVLWSQSYWIKVDKSTLAINFPNMLDTEDTPIFASLNPSGKGGDFDNTYSYNETVFIFESQETIPYFQDWSDFKVVGIKE